MSIIKQAIEVLNEVNLKNIKVYDMRDKSPFYDFFIVATAGSERQSGAVLSHFKKTELKVRNIEESTSWQLVDLHSVIVNIFLEDTREYYNLDKLFFGLEVNIEEL